MVAESVGILDRKSVDEISLRIRESIGGVLVLYTCNSRNIQTGCFGSRGDYRHRIAAGIINGDAVAFEPASLDIPELKSSFVGLPLQVPVERVFLFDGEYSSLRIPHFRLENLQPRYDTRAIVLGESHLCLDLAHTSHHYFIGESDFRQNSPFVIFGVEARDKIRAFVAHVKHS